VSYTLAAVLGVAAAAIVDWSVLRTRLLRRAAFWATYPIILFFQLLSNGILTGRDIVRYDPDAIVGLRLAYAPVEDLVFGFALVLLTLSIWVWLGRRGVQRAPVAGQGGRLLRWLRTRGATRGSGQPAVTGLSDPPLSRDDGEAAGAPPPPAR
jgi:lycopene cyclase domain-containing protein